jgi:AraC-like DNA-binding protein
MATEAGIAVDVRYFHLREELRDYFTALYLFSITCPPGELIEDALHPEWASMRLTVSGPPPVACIGAGPLEPKWPIVVSGPTSRAIRFGLQQSQIWGLGLQPAGMARYVRVRASDIADRTINGSTHPAFAWLLPLLGLAGEHGVPPEEMAGRIERFLVEHQGPPVRHERQILACQEALRDPTIASVEELCERVGLGRRSLERLCDRYFGFPPKMLLRRQRFLRSLAQFTVAGRENWSRALDDQYHDQAHFVRDFKAFMGMTPTEYAAAPHPVLDRIIVQRMADQGALPQTDLPTLLRYGKMS